MDFLLWTIFVAVPLATSVVAQYPVCNEVELPPECICSNSYTLICPGPKDGSYWDMKQTFDAVSDAINNDDAIFYVLEITSTNLLHPQPIEANTITRLKVETLSFHGDKFSEISSEAFPGTYNYTTRLRFGVTGLEPASMFGFFNQFQALTNLDTYYLNEIPVVPVIPANAFEGPLALTRVDFNNAGVQNIGDYAFAGLNNLFSILLQFNGNLTVEGISAQAFSSMNPNASVSLDYNEGIKYLPEDKFKEFLNHAQDGKLYLGDWLGDPKYKLHCDSKADWICTNAGHYKNVLRGFNCIEPQYLDVFEYCEVTK